MQSELLTLIAARNGHFKLESGHHGTLWLDLDPLFVRPGRLRRFVAGLADKLAGHGVEAVCGPLTGGAFLAQAVAAALDVEFHYTERVAPAELAACTQ
jgi:orotate phosphoribosyltransferase